MRELLECGRQAPKWPLTDWTKNSSELSKGHVSTAVGITFWSTFTFFCVDVSKVGVEGCVDVQIFIKPLPKRSSHSKASVEERAIYALDYFFATKPGGKAIILLAICASLTGIGGTSCLQVATLK
jgi:hypothetical protein